MTIALARRLLVASLALGVLGNWVLRADSWRLGFVVWVVALAAVALGATPPGEPNDPSRPREHRLLMGAAIAVALLLVVRDAAVLYAVDFFALLVLAALIGWRAAGRPLAQLVPRDAVAGGLAVATTAISGAPVLALRDASPRHLGADDRRTLGGFALGSLIALPVLFVVGNLLAEADPVFGGFLDRIGDLLDAGLVGNIVGIAGATWLAAGALRGSLVSVTGGLNLPAVLATRVAFPIVAPLLGGLALLLTLWIGSQVGVLFGGSQHVIETAGMTYAEYARRGFFELIVVSGIVLAALLGTDEFLDRGDERGRRSFRAVGVVLLLLVGILLASALQRLGLYLTFYGLTDERVLALAILVWVALVMAWFGWTVLRDARHRFAPGVLVLSALWLATFNAVNPERWIVRTNLARAEAGKEFDIKYHLTLSGDALPALLDGAPRLGPAGEAELRAALVAEWEKRAADRGDWRRWSLPYARALRRIESAGAPATAAMSPAGPSAVTSSVPD